MKVTFRDICWFAVVALIMLFLSKCHRDETVSMSDRFHEINTRLMADSIAHFRAVAALEESLHAEKQATDSAARKAQAASAVVSESQATINRLTTALRTAKHLPVDGNFITVAPTYVTYCDSLADATDALAQNFNTYRLTQGAVISGKDRQLLLKDSLLIRERTFSAGCRTEVAALQAIYTKVQQENKPRNQVFLGAEISGTQATVFQNIGGVLSLKTKRNKLWQISSGIQSNGQVYGRINGNILISFKK